MYEAIGKRAMAATAAGAFILVLAGCPQKEGPVEHAGKEVDKAMDKAGQQVEKAGDKIQDVAKGENEKK